MNYACCLHDFSCFQRYCLSTCAGDGTRNQSNGNIASQRDATFYNDPYTEAQFDANDLSRCLKRAGKPAL
jgi:hypothetical protein